MNHSAERSMLSWRDVLERLLDYVNLKLVILEPCSTTSAWAVAIIDASKKYTCIIHNLPGESSWRSIDTKYSVVYPKSQIFGSSEEEACCRMLKTLIGTEVRWLSNSKSEEDPRKTFTINHVKVPRIMTSDVYVARMSLDLLLS